MKTIPFRFEAMAIAACLAFLALRLVWYQPYQLAALRDLKLLRGEPITLLFLGWNLVLAAVPLLLCGLLYRTRRPVVSGLVLVGWLLFLPNAPYIVTDLVHLRPREPIPYPVDVVLFFSFAATGVLLGARSVLQVGRWLRGQQWYRLYRMGSWLLFPLVGFGVYLGRVRRWNSWDMLLRPDKMVQDLFAVLADPGGWLEMAGFTGMYGLLLAAACFLLVSIEAHQQENQDGSGVAG